MIDDSSPAGVDVARFDPWLARTAPELRGSRPVRLDRLTGGLSNLTYRVDSDAGDLVLRRPPLGHVLSTAHDMAREYRVIEALRTTAVPVPGARLFHDDTAGDAGVGTPFYLMDFVDGSVLESPADVADYPSDELRGLSLALVDALADLHELDPASVGLGDFGRPEGYLERQMRRWATQYDGNRSRELPELDALLAALGQRLPTTASVSLLHGDYRLDNAIVSRDAEGAARIAAVLDWEMATLGDSYADLGMLGLYWDIATLDGPAGVAPGPVAPGIGFPDFAELTERYAHRRGITLPPLGWYLAFSAAKLAIILEGIHRRHLSGGTVGAGFDRVGELVTPLARRGLETLGEDR